MTDCCDPVLSCDALENNWISEKNTYFIKLLSQQKRHYQSWAETRVINKLENIHARSEKWVKVLNTKNKFSRGCFGKVVQTEMGAVAHRDTGVSLDSALIQFRIYKEGQEKWYKLFNTHIYLSAKSNSKSGELGNKWIQWRIWELRSIQVIQITIKVYLYPTQICNVLYFISSKMQWLYFFIRLFFLYFHPNIVLHLHCTASLYYNYNIWKSSVGNLERKVC